MWIVCHRKSVPELQQVFMECIFGIIISNCYQYSRFELVTEDVTVTKGKEGSKTPTTRNKEPKRCSEDKDQTAANGRVY